LWGEGRGEREKRLSAGRRRCIIKKGGGCTSGRPETLADPEQGGEVNVGKGRKRSAETTNAKEGVNKAGGECEKGGKRPVRNWKNAWDSKNQTRVRGEKRGGV